MWIIDTQGTDRKSNDVRQERRTRRKEKYRTERDSIRIPRSALQIRGKSRNEGRRMSNAANHLVVISGG